MQAAPVSALARCSPSAMCGRSCLYVQSQWVTSIRNLSDRFEQFLIQPAVADRPVAALYARILSQLARLNVFVTDVPLLYTWQQRVADVFRAVVAADHLGLTSLFDDLVQRPGHRADGNDSSTAIPKPCRLKSSTTSNSRKLRPSRSAHG